MTPEQIDIAFLYLCIGLVLGAGIGLLIAWANKSE